PHPRRDAPGRDPLLVERLPVDALREALQRGRPLVERPQDPVAHREVVAEDVTFGEAALREIHLVRTGQPHSLPGDLHLFRLRGHAPTIPARATYAFVLGNGQATARDLRLAYGATEDRGRVAGPAVPRRIPGAASGRHRAGVHRRIRQHQDQGGVPL